MNVAPLSALSGMSRATSQEILRWFPVPNLLFPAAAGIDISDASIKWLVFERTRYGKRIRSYGEVGLPEGIVVGGIVHDVSELSRVLREVKKKLPVECAHAALPEEAAYVFSLHVPEQSSRAQVHAIIEFEFEGRVPIPPSAAVYDFDVIGPREGGLDEVGVVVFPRELAESYFAAFSGAGIRLLSLEIEARSIARAVWSDRNNQPISLLVDFGRLRTGIAVLKRGIPIFTSTVAVGGNMADQALSDRLSFTHEEAVLYRNEHGLAREEGSIPTALEAVGAIASALADEVSRHFHYWDTRRNERGERMTPVERVLLVGGSANLKGLTDYIASRVKAECERPDVWQHVCSFDEYIPPIDRHISLQYATAIGLALRGR